MSVSRILCFSYLVFSTLFIVPSDSSSLLISKCCPDLQYLDHNLAECIDLPENSDKSERIPEQRYAKDFPAFPPWLSSEKHSNISLMFGVNNTDYHIELGAKAPCDLNMTAMLNSSEIASYDLSNNGSLLYHGNSGGKDIIFPPESYCADKVKNNVTVPGFYHAFLLCPCLSNNCVKKCCAHDEIMQIGESKSKCVNKKDVGKTWYSFGDGELLHEEVHSKKHLFNCSQTEKADVNVWSLKNSTVLSNFVDEHVDGFCGEMAVIKRNSETAVKGLLRCSWKVKPKEKKSNKEWSHIIYPFSSIFLVFTLIVFALVPETRNTKSNIVICHIISLLAIYILRTTGRRPDNGVFTDAECLVLFFFHHFFYLSASFWITALCMDIAMTFRVFRPTQSIIQHGKQKRRFYWYSIGCWGGPALFLTAIAIMEFSPGIPDYYIKPQIAAGTCGIWGYERVWIYFHGPQMVLSIINSFLLLFTLIKICKAHCSMGMLESEDSGRHMKPDKNSCMSGKKRYIVYINLLCLMGPPRLVPMIHWAVTNDWDLVIYLDYVGDILRAVSLMLFVCCKPGIPQLFLQKLRVIGSKCFCCRNKKSYSHQNQKVTFKDLKDKESSGMSDSSALSNTDS